MIETIKTAYHVLSILTLLISLILIIKNNIIKLENCLIIYIILIFNFFDIFIWILPSVNQSKNIGSLAYDILFPLFIMSIIIFKKHLKILSSLVIVTTISSQFLIKTSKQIPVNGEFKIVLSFIACLILIYNVYKNLKKIRFQTYMMLLISCIPLFDMFFSVAYFKIISFEMNTWKIFINSYIVFLSITCCIFIYYYGKQLLKNSSPTI